MKKRLLLIPLFLFISMSNLTAQGIGAYFCNSYPAGKWAEYIKTSVGGGISAEYKLPLNFDIVNIGFNLRTEYTALIPKDLNKINSGSDATIIPGVFVSIPFSIGSLNASFVTELSYGIVVHKIKLDEASDIYIDQLICVSPGLRFYTPNYEKLMWEFAPFSTFAFEKSGVIMQAGFRLGTIWHFID